MVHTLALGDFFFPPRTSFLTWYLFQTSAFQQRRHRMRQVVAQFFFSRLKQNACLGFLVDALHPLAPPGYGYSDDETLLWWCNEVVTSERQQCAGWTSCCVTCLMLYVIFVSNVAYGVGFSVLERRSCKGAHGNKCGSVD
jgi:hypothetical protein